MIKKMHYSFMLFVLLFGLMTNTGCSKRTINNYYEVSDESDESSGTASTKYNVAVKADLNSLASTKTSDTTYPLAVNRYVDIYTYDQGADGEFVSTTSFVTKEAGILSPTKNALSLTAGHYEFYAIGIGSSNADVPVITNTDYGSSKDLVNGVDYIYCGHEDDDITGPTTLELIFNHICSQIIINVTASTGLTIDSIISASITQPTPGTFYLFTGIMTTSQTFMTSSIDMNVNKTTLT